MGQRNMQCPYQMPFLKSGHDQCLFYQDHSIHQGNIINHPSQSMRPEMAIPGTAADVGLNQVRNHHDMNKNSYDIIQNPHLVTNANFACTVPLNPDNHHHVPSFSSFSVSRDVGSTDKFPSSSTSRLVGVSMDEYGRHNSFADYVRASCKRKNPGVVPGNHYYDNGLGSPHVSSSSFSVISEQPLWNEPYNSGFNPLNPSTVTQAGYGGNHVLQAMEGSHINLWSRSNGATIQSDSSPVHHGNYLRQGDCIGQSAPPANSLVAPFGNNAGGGDYSNWSSPQSVTHLRGRYFGSRDVEMANMGIQGYQEIPFSANSAILFHATMPNPALMPTFHQHLAPLHNIPVQNFGQHINFPVPSYQLPLHSFCPSTFNPLFNSLDSGNRFLPCPPPNAELICGPLQQLQTAVSVNHRNLRLLSTEDPAVLELPRFYGVGDVIDRHRDMRLDIDDMSYEELLALEEQIGDVSTGLTEESILQNLKTSFHVPLSRSSLSDCSPRSFPENETCTICQAEYEENERLGTLNCGHKYHADCIKQWLLVKNICPICKTSSLASDDKRDA